MPRLIFEALRANPDGLNLDQLTAVIIEQEGFDPSDQETVATIRQRCTMALYRYYDKGQIVKERRETVRVWRLA